MRGRDDDTGEYLGPSRSEQRRAALDVLALAQQLVGLSAAQLAKLPAKQMRREDDATLDAIRDGLDAGGEAGRRETALLHRIEGWRDRLLADGDVALADLLVEHPDADRQHLRQLLRNAVEERNRNKPPHAARELFRVLREMLSEPETGSREPRAEGQNS